MILETLDIKQNDVFIYSENKFDFEQNFCLINKDDKVKRVIPIHFNEVCRYINSSDPKSVIIYRLLTNLSSFKTDIIKYGVMIKINGEHEIVHFDPIFAVKELEEYVKSNEITDVRFRIQQVGLLSQISSFGKPNYQEIYAFDLEVAEAKWQNDRVFAELIFAFDDINFDTSKKISDVKKIRVETAKQIPRFKKVTVEEVQNDLIEEVRNFDAQKMKKLTYLPIPGAKNLSPERKSSSSLNAQNDDKSTDQKRESKSESFASFLRHAKTDPNIKEPTTESGKNKGNVIDLFKSSQHVHQYVVAREQKQIVLKLKGD